MDASQNQKNAHNNNCANKNNNNSGTISNQLVRPVTASSCPPSSFPGGTGGSDLTASLASPNTSPASSAMKRVVTANKDRETNSAAARPRRMLTNSSVYKKRPVRRLVPPSRSIFLDKSCASVTEFLRPSLIPVGYTPETIDPSFKAHTSMLRKLTLDDFDLNRYLFCYKPLAKVNAVLAMILLAVLEIDSKTCPMSPALRSAIMYIAGNSHRSLYVMTYAAQLKSTARSRPAGEGILPAMVLEGRGLSDVEVAALDFAQELCSAAAVVTEATRKKVIHGSVDAEGRLERLITATSAYGAFLSCLTSTIDIELTHGSIQYAVTHLEGLPWKSSGSPMNVDFFKDEMGDFGTGNTPSGLGSKYRPKRERLSLTRNYDRHARDRSGGRARSRGLRRVSHFFTSTLLGSKSVSDVHRVTETWMKEAEVPTSGQLFDMNDEIQRLFGFHPFYLSTAAMEGELMRRGFLYGMKELLFNEGSISRRLKFIVCYVLTSGKERRRIVDSEHSRSFEKQGVHNGNSINSVYSQRAYDALSILSAHAAFLACKYGAKPAELVAASDVSRVRSAMERYAPDGNSKITCHSIGFPLTRRDCSVVLIAHSLVKETACISNEDLKGFDESFGSSRTVKEDNLHTSRQVLMEVLGAASMWQCIERYATGTLGFDIDCTSNMVFGLGRAEPTISEFCRGSDGRKIGLSLASNENRDVIRGRSDSRASRTSSLRPSGQSSNRVYRKRTSSALNSGTRVGRLFSNSSGPEEMHQAKRAVVVAT